MTCQGMCGQNTNLPNAQHTKISIIIYDNSRKSKTKALFLYFIHFPFFKQWVSVVF